MKEHYKIFGLKESADLKKLKSAHRKLVLKYHPDKNPDPKAKDKFLRVQESYKILVEHINAHPPEEQPKKKWQKFKEKRIYETVEEAVTKHSSQQNYSRSYYDATSYSKTKSGAEQPRQDKNKKKNSWWTSASRNKSHQQTDAEQKQLTQEQKLAELELLFQKRKFDEAEKIAQELIKEDPFNYRAFATLGDIEKERGNIHSAANAYIYAAQMAPEKEVYQKKHAKMVQLLKEIHFRNLQKNIPYKRIATGCFIIVLAAIYVALAKEPAISFGISLISSWSLGLISMLLLSGLSIGGTLSSANYLPLFSWDKFFPQKKQDWIKSPHLLASFQLWIASFLYFPQRIRGGFQEPISILFVLCLLGAILMTFASVFNENLLPQEVLLWGGNILYIGSLLGWMIGDYFKKAKK